MQNSVDKSIMRKSVDEQLLDLERQHRIKKENNALEGKIIQIMSRLPKDHKIHSKLLEIIQILRDE